MDGRGKTNYRHPLKMVAAQYAREDTVVSDALPVRPPGADFTATEMALEPDMMALARTLNQASQGERVRLIRNGVAASRILELVEAMHVSRERLLGMLNLPDASVKRKIRQRAMLSQEQSERVLGLLRLIGQVAVMVEHSGDPKEFDAARWVGDWIERPIPALGGSRPADYMETLVGQTIVSQLFAQSQAAVFA